MTCPACARAAEHPRTGIYTAGCPSCAARALAQSPEFAEAARSGVLTPKYRMALAQFKVEHADVKQWAERLHTEQRA